MADICFQMFAEVADVDQLLNMIRSSTDLRDHIRFNGEDQPLILMNPGGFFKKYLMPTVPSSARLGENVMLKKGYYKGVVFSIPGAEVLINGEWKPFEDTDKELITAQNPFTLQWRLNGTRLRKLGYKQGTTLTGKVIAVDDQWNDLNLSIDITLVLSYEDTNPEIGQ